VFECCFVSLINQWLATYLNSYIPNDFTYEISNWNFFGYLFVSLVLNYWDFSGRIRKGGQKPTQVLSHKRVNPFIPIMSCSYPPKEQLYTPYYYMTCINKFNGFAILAYIGNQSLCIGE